MLCVQNTEQRGKEMAASLADGSPPPACPFNQKNKSSKHQSSFPQHPVFRRFIQKTFTLQGQEAAAGNGIPWEKGTLSHLSTEDTCL